MDEVARVSSKNQVVIPKETRERLGIEPGDELSFMARDGYLIARKKPASFTDWMWGLHREAWRGVDVDEYVERERRSWEEKPEE